MTEQVTIEEKMNEIIAVFMDFERYEDSSGVWFKKEGLITSMHPNLKDLKYHLSWDKLMPVWYKFRDLQFESTKLQKEHSDWESPINNAICYQGIKSAHLLLCLAIQWLNKQQP